MLKKIRARMTYANVMATIAVFAALGMGSAYAATKLTKGSVTTKSIKNNAVKGTKIANNAVSTPKIANGAVTSAKAGQGVLRDMVIVTDREPNTGETDTATKQAFATCPAGHVLTGGGTRIIGDADDDDIVTTVDMPIVEEAPGLKQWFGQASHVGGGLPGDDWALVATAICAKA